MGTFQDSTGHQDMEKIARCNQVYLDALTSGDQDQLNKVAAEMEAPYIRLVLRERGILRNLITPTPARNSDLVPTLEPSSLPRIIDFMEGALPGAATVPFNATTDIAWYTENRFEIIFEYIQTKTYEKNINELRTQRNMDLRNLTLSNNLIDLETQEDVNFFNLCHTLVGPEGGVSPFTGRQQNHVINGGWTRENVTELVNFLIDNKLPNGVMVMNARTGNQYLKWGRDMWGGDGAEKMVAEGLKGAVTKARLWGVNHLFTIKNDIIADNEVWIFTTQDFLGRFKELETTKVYIKREEDIITHKAKELIGVTIANVPGVHRVRFAQGN